MFQKFKDGISCTWKDVLKNHGVRSLKLILNIIETGILYNSDVCVLLIIIKQYIYNSVAII